MAKILDFGLPRGLNITGFLRSRSTASQRYDLRRRTHSFQLPGHSTRLSDCISLLGCYTKTVIGLLDSVRRTSFLISFVYFYFVHCLLACFFCHTSYINYIYKLNADELKRLQIEVWFGKVLLIRRLTNGESSMKIRQESPAIADKPARRESLPKLLQFHVPTTLSLTILAYLHAFNCYCVRNPRNPEKFTENSNL